ncbi:unnamed protein product [Debaryomyces tyrocola]|nr:unnamed protein product [Debaryomyces tyrocola]
MLLYNDIQFEKISHLYEDFLKALRYCR